MIPETIVCPTVLLHPDAQVPTRSSEGAGGHDIRCVAGTEGLVDCPFDDAVIAGWSMFALRGSVSVLPGQGITLRTGFAQAIDPGFICTLWDRSSMGGLKDIHRFAGLIDPTYRGEWYVRLFNHSNRVYTFKPGDKIVQGVYQRRVEATCPIVTSLPASERNTGGHGSTGR